MLQTLLLSIALAGDVEATSLLGRPLTRPELPAERRAKLEDDLARAKAELDVQPDSQDAAIWYGRRLAYLGRYRDAIDAFSNAIEKHPQSHKLLRHRGHRYITVREFDKAVADLTRAAELSSGVKDEPEPDGAPNAKNIPRSTSLSNIWYHLALAHYLKGNFNEAARCWRTSLELPQINADIEVSSSYWLYLSLRRAGKDAEAGRVLESIGRVMPVIENQAYHALLLLFKGETTEARLRESAGGDAIADSTIGYGLGAWKLINDDAAGAREQFERVLRGPNWAAFGYIAAEVELARR